jgi:very-short-patch-repair endonuclease
MKSRPPSRSSPLGNSGSYPDGNCSNGCTEAQIERRLRTGRWELVLPGVYRIAGAPATVRQAAMGAALWGGPEALVSHATAARLWRFEQVLSRKLELWVPPTRSIRSKVVSVHRGTRLDRADRTQLGPIPLTTPTRTLIDMAGRLEDHRLHATMEDLFRRNLVDRARLRARLDALRSSGRPGGGRLDALLEQRGNGPAMESALETLVWPLIIQAGVPLPVRQHWVVLAAQRFRLDFAWPECKVGLECDGQRYHSSWASDRARLAEFASTHWRILPVTWEAASRRPRRVIDWLRGALAPVRDSLAR